MIASPHSDRIDAYLAGPVVDARLELVTYLGATALGRYTPAAGTVSWDGTERRGVMDVDIATGIPSMHDAHTVGRWGQAIQAAWTWPALGVSIPLGWWLITAPQRLDSTGTWRVTADPEGPAHLARAQWWEPGERTISGVLGAQLAQMVGAAGVVWVPTADYTEWRIPATRCEAGATILSSVQTALDQAGAYMRPRRIGRGIDIGREDPDGLPQWTWRATDPAVLTVRGEPSTDEVPNRVTVWCEEDRSGTRVVRGHSEPLRSGPRRWGGPYGQVPRVIRLDQPATDDDMRAQARQVLARAQESTGAVQVEMRADPRVEVGDIARIISEYDGTDCTGRVTAVKIDATSGVATVETSVVHGTVAGYRL